MTRRFSNENYYAILGVSRRASKDEIKAAYRVLARKTHPDAGGDHERFAKIAEAWEVLSDDDEREFYDAERSLQARASRPYTNVTHPPTPATTRSGSVVSGPDDGLTDTERWMRNKRRF